MKTFIIVIGQIHIHRCFNVSFVSNNSYREIAS